MRIPSNKISSVIRFFHSELQHLYPEGEINAFVRISFQHALGLSAAKLLLHKEDTLTESELLRFNFIIKDLKKGKPIQYILGTTEFYGHQFKTDSRALIPRPETEELVDWILKEMRGPDLAILDIGTGSGCIAISLKLHSPAASVTAMDISEAALSLAKENANQLKAEVEFFQGDAAVLSSLPERKFDVIVSNPPYILPAEKSSLPENVVNHEPGTALFTPENDALFFYRQILEYATTHLTPNGRLFFEIHEEQAESLVKYAEKVFKNVILRQDLNEKPRMLCVYSPY